MRRGAPRAALPGKDFGVPIEVHVSTIYLRYHYLSDALAGIALGALCAFAGCAWHRRYLERKPPA